MLDLTHLSTYDRQSFSRGIAQSGSAPALGAGCRGFESLYPDQMRQEAIANALVAHLDRATAF